MKAFARIAALGLLSVGLAGFGCSTDNEDIVKEQQKANAGKPVEEAPAPPKSQAEYGKRQQQSSPYSKSSGYPGAK